MNLVKQDLRGLQDLKGIQAVLALQVPEDHRVNVVVRAFQENRDLPGIPHFSHRREKRAPQVILVCLVTQDLQDSLKDPKMTDSLKVTEVIQEGKGNQEKMGAEAFLDLMGTMAVLVSQGSRVQRENKETQEGWGKEARMVHQGRMVLKEIKGKMAELEYQGCLV